MWEMVVKGCSLLVVLPLTTNWKRCVQVLIKCKPIKGLPQLCLGGKAQHLFCSCV